MGRIIVDNLSFYYDKYYYPVFENVNFQIDTSWKLGLIGRNGRGKTTLLKLIHEILEPSGGKIQKELITAFYPYELDFNYSNVEAFMKENIAGLSSVEKKIHELEINNKTESDEYSNLLNIYIELGGYSIQSNILKELKMIDIDPAILQREYSELSNGEQTKLQIVIIFLKNPDFILLDEPSNHLDAFGRKVLAKYLNQKHGFIIASHDRVFMDQIIDHIISINKKNIEIHKGNFTSWKSNKELYEQFEIRKRRNIEKKIIELNNASISAGKWSKNSNDKKYLYRSNSRERSKSLMSKARSLEKKAEKKLLDSQKLLQNYEIIPELEINQEIIENEVIVEVINIGFRYSEEWLFNDISFDIRKGERLCITGKNGAGKTTLLNIIMNHFTAQVGDVYINPKAQIIYDSQIDSILLNKEELKGDTEQYNLMIEICKLFDVNDSILARPFETFSEGERRKLKIAKALSSKNNLLIMDEPLNFTDIYFRQQFEKAILKYKPTMIFVEHDQAFSSKIGTKYIEL